MANFNATSVSKSGAAGGIFNMTDADYIAYAVVFIANPDAFDAVRPLLNSGAVPSSVEETWGILTG